MTLRLVALVLAAALALPATVAILRTARAGRDTDAPTGRGRLETLWSLLPVVLLVALVALAAAA